MGKILRPSSHVFVIGTAQQYTRIEKTISLSVQVRGFNNVVSYQHRYKHSSKKLEAAFSSNAHDFE